MPQQLRLVDPPPAPAATGSSRRTSSSRSSSRTRTVRARAVRTTSPRARRAASWGEWQLDPRTRQVGKAGVAAARRALEDAAAGAHAVQKQRRAS